jgi:PAS domain S-box-containing protein
VILASTSKLTFTSPEFWVYLLGLSILLGIALRRVVLRQNPLNDELYCKTVAIEHVQSGVAWVRPDGGIKSINSAFAEILAAHPADFVGKSWFDLFASQELERLKDSYSQTLLLGKTNLRAFGKRADGTFAGLEVRLVAVHDHKMRFVGHYCLVADHTREQLLEEQIHDKIDDKIDSGMSSAAH